MWGVLVDCVCRCGGYEEDGRDLTKYGFEGGVRLEVSWRWRLFLVVGFSGAWVIVDRSRLVVSGLVVALMDH